MLADFKQNNDLQKSHENILANISSGLILPAVILVPQ